MRINLIALVFNLSYIMLAFLIPLDALHLGYAPLAIGIVTGLPGLLQMPLRALSGPLCDLYGERGFLLLSFACGVVAGAAIGFAPGELAALLTAQVAIGTARGFYWVAAQSYVARLPGERRQALGVFTSLNQVGSISGILVAGPLAVWAGYGVAFGLCGALQGVCLLLAVGLPALPPTGSGRGLWQVVAELPAFAVRRPVLVSSAANMLAAVPQALVQSFYPVYLAQMGLAAGAVSLLTSLRGLGVVAAGFLFTRIYRRLGTWRVCALGGVLLGAAIAATAAHSLTAVAAGILVAGVASGVLTVMATVIVVEAGAEQDRGSYLALTNLGYAASMFATPLVFGAGASHGGLGTTFVVVGIAVALAAPLAVWARRLALPGSAAA